MVDAKFNCPRCKSPVDLIGERYRCTRDTCSWGLNPTQPPPENGFMIFCWHTPHEEDPGDYVLATRQVFPNRESAEGYAKTIARSRCPLVIPRTEIIDAVVNGYRANATWDLEGKN